MKVDQSPPLSAKDMKMICMPPIQFDGLLIVKDTTAVAVGRIA
jgi:hypothetical protein